MSRLLALEPGSRPASGPRTVAALAGQPPIVALAIAGAWLLIGAAQLTGAAGLLHHHALIEHGPPLWIGVPAFLAGWLVMIVAMMLPASMPAIAGFVGSLPRPDRAAGPSAAPAVLRFLAPYALVWAGFGLAVFLCDLLVHRLVDTTPWLDARPWLIDASVIGFAGVYQFLPVKRRGLEACRHPGAGRAASEPGDRGGHRAGLDHALACLVSSGGLMLLMFAEGFSSAWPMVGLTAVMLYEAVGRHGQRAAQIVGVLLLAVAIAVIVTGASV